MQTLDEKIAVDENMDLKNKLFLQNLKRSNRRKKIRINIIGTAMASLPFIGFLCFSLFPMLVSLYVSFTDLYSYNLSQATWTGFSNYINVFKDEMLGTSVLNTLQWMLTVPITLVLTIIFANAVSKNIFGTKFARVVFFLPQVCSSVAVTLMWQWMFSEYGVINTVLENFGANGIPWMSHSDYFMWAIVIIGIWKTGTNCIVMEAAFANVDRSLQEAARVDGADDTHVFWKITLPQLTPTIFYVLTMNLLAAMQEQTIMQVLASGLNNGAGPGNKAVTLVYYIYRMAFNYRTTMGMGMSCALSWITALIIMLITKLNFRLSKYWVCYD